jgi:DNA invertase Pin-like site-specific DNA recombinase
MMISKIADRHLSREACIYIRQSTMGQVRFNQESTERQYNLASKAQSLGWSSERIRILDRDLGQSGARTTNREDFKTLVSDVAMSQVGAIFSLEASRLARSIQDWHRLLELCAITGTLVIDEDGCYDPAEFNRPCARHEGHVRSGRAAHHPRAPPRRQDQQGEQR